MMNISKLSFVLSDTQDNKLRYWNISNNLLSMTFTFRSGNDTQQSYVGLDSLKNNNNNDDNNDKKKAMKWIGKKKEKIRKTKRIRISKKTRLVSEEKSDRNICVSNKQHDKNNNQNEINKSCEVTANYLCML